MKMYDGNGYVNMQDLIRSGFPFIMVVGGRGTGKTYGSLQDVLTEQEEGLINRFLYLRRMQTETDMVGNQALSPFKKLNADKGWNITSKSIRQSVYGFFREDALIGYAASLSTFRNLRGFDFSDVDIIIYDEFIPEAGARPIKHEAQSLFNVYESINRNRELSGDPPVRLVCLSNSNELGNPIFMELGIISKLEKMSMQGGGTLRDRSRGLMVVLLKDSPISNKKKQTALYKLTGSSSFTGMALENTFIDNDRDGIKPQSLVEYILETTIDGIAIYKHKSSPTYYICNYSGVPEYTTNERDLERWQLRYYYLFNRYIDGQLYFEDYLTKRLFLMYNKGR